MTGFDDMQTVASDETDQNGIHYGKCNIERGGFHATTALALDYAYLESPEFTNSKEQKKSLLKRKQDSYQTLCVSQPLTLSVMFRPFTWKGQR